MTNKLTLTFFCLCVLVCGCAEKSFSTSEKDTYNIKIITDAKVIDVNAQINKGYRPNAITRDNLVIYSGFDNGEIIVPASAICIVQKLVRANETTTKE